ncbi:hypothetical protein Vadar_003810 [Vaccinium darrowii]|uniref:Uncharacterized protein n=1 Tax=Vaccinium darrowii TaxID=229202 RepID=A0ACB7YCX6_9ERIC|nr:hypothetical protein Vadar_003810 [Vaccinium darrowii]
MKREWKGKAVAETSSATAPRSHRIPGPAGDLEDALERRAAGEAKETMDTQQFIHRALTIPSKDTNFVTNSAWLTVVREGYMERSGYTDLATAKKVKRFQRLPLEDVDQRLGEDGGDVDVEIGINETSILEAPSTIMTRDTWTNVVDPTPVIPYSNIVKEDPSLKIKVLQAMVKELTCGFNPSYDKTWLGKQIAIASIFGDWDDSYQKLSRYLAVVQQYNPDTEFKINTVPSIAPGTVIFDQVFWAFTPAIEGFRHCRPVICVDGTFLTGKYRGVMLIALSQDAENQIFPIAFAIAEARPKKVGAGSSIVYDATSQNKHGQAAGRHVFWAAQELQPRKFERELNKTKRFVVTNGPDKGQEKVYDDVMNIPLDRWSFAHDNGKQYGSLTTNVVKCFNGVLKDARHLPITALVMTTFFKFVEYFTDKSRTTLAKMNAGHVYSSFATNKYEHWRQKAR